MDGTLRLGSMTRKRVIVKSSVGSQGIFPDFPPPHPLTVILTIIIMMFVSLGVFLVLLDVLLWIFNL